MKVVLFCGGLGTRLREHSETIPKPLVNIGYRPIIWHLMRYYAHYGHTEFVLCLGYRGDLIKEYFVNYSEWQSNDFVLSEGGRKLEPLLRDIATWRITFIETGLHSNIGERLLAVREHLGDDEFFLANYSDALTDLPLDQYIEDVRRREVIAGMIAVKPWQSFHSVSMNGDGRVEYLGPIRESAFWLNGGFFVFRRDVFDYIRPGEDLVEQPFRRLIEERQLHAHRHAGFWAAMDTLKDKIAFDRMNGRGETPWKVW